MKMLCPICGGTGVAILLPRGLAVPKQSMEEIMKTAKKELCKKCNGTGEVESGFLAVDLGLKSKTINESQK